MNHISPLLGRIIRISQGQLFPRFHSVKAISEQKVTCLQDTKVEFALSIGTYFRALIALCRGDKLQWVSSHRVVYCERDAVPINFNGKVVPGSVGELGGEQHIRCVIQDIQVVCVSGREIARRISER